MKKIKSCIICKRDNPYESLVICDLCHHEYETDELKELIKAHYQNIKVVND